MSSQPPGSLMISRRHLVKFVDVDLGRLGNWRAWVNKVARNEAIDHLRRERNRWWGVTDLDASTSAPPKQLSEVGPSAAGMWPRIITKLTESLGDREREMLLASLDGASNDDIARDFGYAGCRSVAVILTRARARLRAAFTDRQKVLKLLGPQRLS